MQPQIVYGKFYRVETMDGTFLIPDDVLSNETNEKLDWLDDCFVSEGSPFGLDEDEGKNLFQLALNALEMFIPTSKEKVNEIDRTKGYFARLSMPGYLDCTDWGGPFHTEELAKEYLTEMYDVKFPEDDGDDFDYEESMMEEIGED